jgi:hypothetical protein
MRGGRGVRRVRYGGIAAVHPGSVAASLRTPIRKRPFTTRPNHSNSTVNSTAVDPLQTLVSLNGNDGPCLKADLTGAAGDRPIGWIPVLQIWQPVMSTWLKSGRLLAN